MSQARSVGLCNRPSIACRSRGCPCAPRLPVRGLTETPSMRLSGQDRELSREDLGAAVGSDRDPRGGATDRHRRVDSPSTSSTTSAAMRHSRITNACSGTSGNRGPARAFGTLAEGLAVVGGWHVQPSAESVKKQLFDTWPKEGVLSLVRRHVTVNNECTAGEECACVVCRIAAVGADGFCLV